jgi:hypothetical protein
LILYAFFNADKAPPRAIPLAKRVEPNQSRTGGPPLAVRFSDGDIQWARAFGELPVERRKRSAILRGDHMLRVSECRSRFYPCEGVLRPVMVFKLNACRR